MDTGKSCKVESLTRTYVHARQGGDLELALQIAFRLEDAKRGEAPEAVADAGLGCSDDTGYRLGRD